METILRFTVFSLALLSLVIGASSSAIQTIQGELIATLGLGSFRDAAWSPDSQLLAIASTRGVWLYSIEDLTGEPDLLPVAGGVHSLRFSPTGKYLATTGYDGRIWDVASRQEHFTIYERKLRQPREDYQPTVGALTFSPDEAYIGVKELGFGNFSLWNVASGEMTLEQKGIFYQFLDDARTFLYADVRDWTLDLKLRDLVTGETRPALSFDQSTRPSNTVIRVLPDNVTLLTSYASYISTNPTTYERGLLGWSLSSGEIINTIYQDNSDVGSDLRIPTLYRGDPNIMAFFVIADNDFTASVIVVNAQTSTLLQQFSGYQSLVTDMDFSDDGRLLLTAENFSYETDESYLKLWDIETGLSVANSVPFIRSNILKARFSPDGSRVVSVHSDGIVRIWSSADLELEQTLGYGVVDAQLASNGTSVVMGNQSGGIHLAAIDLDNLSLRETSSTQVQSLPMNSISADTTLSQVIVTTGYLFDSEIDGRFHTIQLWSPLSDQTNIFSQDETVSVHRAILNPQGTILAVVRANSSNQSSTWGSAQVQLWDVGAGTPIGNPFTEPTNYVVQVAFSPDNRLMASGGCGGRNVEGTCDTGEIHIWDLQTQQHLAGPLHEHTSAIYALGFSPDSQYLTSGSGGNIYFGTEDDYSIALWDSRSGNVIRPSQTPERDPSMLDNFSGEIRAVAYNSTGALIATGHGNSMFSEDGSIRLWEASSLIELGTLNTTAFDAVEDLVFVDEDQRIISVHIDGTIRIWQLPADE